MATSSKHWFNILYIIIYSQDGRLEYTLAIGICYMLITIDILIRISMVFLDTILLM